MANQSIVLKHCKLLDNILTRMQLKSEQKGKENI